MSNVPLCSCASFSVAEFMFLQFSKSPSLFVKRLFVKDPWVKVELSPPIVHFDVIYLQKKLHLKLLA